MKASMRFAFFAVACVAALALSLSGPLRAAEPEKVQPKPAPTEAAEPPPPHVQVPSSNPLSGDPEAIALGKRLFFTWCVQCHGPKANGESRFGKYAGDLTRFWRGYPEFVVIVKNGRVQKQMPPWKEVLDDDNIAKVGAYLETLSVEGANWK
jgi:mono/diheme cytochrome c family protein